MGGGPAWGSTVGSQVAAKGASQIPPGGNAEQQQGWCPDLRHEYLYQQWGAPRATIRSSRRSTYGKRTRERESERDGDEVRMRHRQLARPARSCTLHGETRERRVRVFVYVHVCVCVTQFMCVVACLSVPVRAAWPGAARARAYELVDYDIRSRHSDSRVCASDTCVFFPGSRLRFPSRQACGQCGGHRPTFLCLMPDTCLAWTTRFARRRPPFYHTKSSIVPRRIRPRGCCAVRRGRPCPSPLPDLRSRHERRVRLACTRPPSKEPDHAGAHAAQISFTALSGHTPASDRCS